MSKYSAESYIRKKLDNIYQETATCKSYQFGLVVGMWYAYRYVKACLSKETADKCFSNLDGNDEYTTILRTLIELDNKEAATYAEKILERYEELKKPNVIMSDEHRELLEGFMEFLYKEEQCVWKRLN